MNLVQITPGAGKMFCGNCLRDNALVAELRALGHDTLMIPLYLPLTLDEPDQSAGAPIFYGGVNVYLDQKSALFRRAPSWFHRALSAPWLLRRVAGRAAKTRAADVGPLTLSMLRGEEGNQARELDDLIAWIKNQRRPDVICLSNALLVGLARRLKSALRVPVVGMLQGEAPFLDSLPELDRAQAWEIVRERARDVDHFAAASGYFADLMRDRLQLDPRRVRVIYNGINAEDFQPAPRPVQPPAIGYFARLCPEKGLDLLVESFILLKAQREFDSVQLRVGGSVGPGDEPFVNSLKGRLARAGLLRRVRFFPNLTRAEKRAFLQTLSVFCVPALYGEAFGLYLIEALAAAVPAVAPRHAAFPELIEATGGGLLAEPNAPSLAAALGQLLRDPDRAAALGATGRQRVLQRFTARRMAAQMIDLCQNALDASASPPVAA